MEGYNKEECESKGGNYLWVSGYRKNDGTHVRGYCKNLGYHLRKSESEKIQRKSGVMHYEGGKYDYSVHHPLSFEDNVYSVSMHRYGENYADRNTYHTQVEASNSKEALKKAKKEMEKHRWK